MRIMRLGYSLFGVVTAVVFTMIAQPFIQQEAAPEASSKIQEIEEQAGPALNQSSLMSVHVQQQAQPEPVKEELPHPPAYRIADVPVLRQLPKYFNGCEVTSTAMLSQYLGLPYTLDELVELLPKDPAPIKRDNQGNIVSWGDPHNGFVGDVTGRFIGYAVYNEPIEQLVNEITGGQAVNLSGGDFSEIEKALASGRPVVAWTTSWFQPVGESAWVEWTSAEGKKIKATFKEHAVLLTGYDEHYVYLNNPINGMKSQKTAKAAFIESWKQLDRQAVTVSSEMIKGQPL